jgi:hypothetical protein
MEHLDPHQRPPDSVKEVYKKYQKMKPKDLDRDLDIVDLPDSLHTSAKDQVRIVGEWSGHNLSAAFRAFSGRDGQIYADLPPRTPVYEHADMPGRTLFHYTHRDYIQYYILRADTALAERVIFARYLSYSFQYGAVHLMQMLFCKRQASSSSFPALTVSRPSYRSQPPSSRDPNPPTLPSSAPRPVQSSASHKHPHTLQSVIPR